MSRAASCKGLQIGYKRVMLPRTRYGISTLLFQGLLNTPLTSTRHLPPVRWWLLQNAEGIETSNSMLCMVVLHVDQVFHTLLPELSAQTLCMLTLTQFPNDPVQRSGLTQERSNPYKRSGQAHLLSFLPSSPSVHYPSLHHAVSDKVICSFHVWGKIS